MSANDLTEQGGTTPSRGVLSSQLAGLHKEVDRLFEDFMGDFRPWRSGIRLWDQGKIKGEKDLGQGRVIRQMRAATVGSPPA